jgi:outer membrane protein OmpA-like peptidoglycan-associated protein
VPEAHEPGRDRRPGLAVRPNLDRGAAEAAKFAELRSLIVGPEQRELSALQAQLADRAARTLEVSGVLPDAIAHRANDPHLVRALAPPIERAITASARRDPRSLAEALFPVIGTAMRKALTRTLAPLITIGSAIVLAGGVWTMQAYRERQQWDQYLERLAQEPGIVVVESGRRGGKFYVSGLKDPLATDPSTLVVPAGLAAEAVTSRWEPYYALHPAFVATRARDLLRPPSGVTLEYNDGLLKAIGPAPTEWVEESKRLAPAVAGVRRFEYSLGSSERAKPADPPAPQSDAEEQLKRRIESTALSFQMAESTLAPGQQETLRELVFDFRDLNRALRARGARATVEIIGHTSDGSNVANQGLSRARAQGVHALLRDYSFDALDFTAIGQETPDAPADPKGPARDRSRRVSFRVHLQNPVDLASR